MVDASPEFLTWEERSLVSLTIQTLRESSVPQHSTCALFQVGSSLVSVDHHDVDLVLVGLDFRSVLSYDHRILPPFHPVPSDEVYFEAPGPYALFHANIRTTHTLDALVAQLAVKLGRTPSRPEQPLEVYRHESARFLVVSYYVDQLHLLIHAENLFVPAWIVHQQSAQLPYQELWRGPSTDTEIPRRVCHTTPYPAFIDPNGKKRFNRARFMELVYGGLYLPQRVEKEGVKRPEMM